jgi:hypothetical protein
VTEPEGAEGAAGDPQIGQLLEGFNSFRGEITGRLDALESDLFEPEGGDEPLPGVPDFPAGGAQPPSAGQPTYPAQPGVAPGFPQQGEPQQPYQGQQAPVAPQLPPEAAQILDQYIGQRVPRHSSSWISGCRPSSRSSSVRASSTLTPMASRRSTRSSRRGAHEAAARSTAAFAQQLGHPELASDPRLLERVLLVERAQAGAAAGGGQAQPGEVHLETTPAAPGGSPSDEDPAAGIVAAAKGRTLQL